MQIGDEANEAWRGDLEAAGSIGIDIEPSIRDGSADKGRASAIWPAGQRREGVRLDRGDLG